MLQAFVQAAQTGNFSRAALGLNLTASAVSHQINKLEEWWGLKLFNRHSRGVDLTKNGQLLLPVTENFFKDLEVVLQSINSNIQTLNPLRLVCTSSLCSTWLTSRILDAKDIDLEIELISGLTQITRLIVI